MRILLHQLKSPDQCGLQLKTSYVLKNNRPVRWSIKPHSGEFLFSNKMQRTSPTNLPQGFNGTEKYYTTDLSIFLPIFHVTGIKEVRENLNNEDIN